MAAKRDGGSKHYVFTSFENELVFDDESMVYMVYGREVCPTTGKRHLQGFVSFKSKRTMRKSKELLCDDKAHLEVMRGTVEQAVTYCKKDGDFIEFGTKPKEKNVAGGEARKRQYDDAWEAAKSGDYESIESSIKLHCWSNIIKIRAHYQCQINIPNLEPGSIVGTWIVGSAGVGKSFFARSTVELRGFKIFNKALNKWWDGYADEEVVLIEDIDDFSQKHMSHHLKIWADEYPFIAEVKGASLKIRPRHVIVTSNYTIGYLWREDSSLEAAIKRRFHVIEAYSREDFDRVSWPDNSTLLRYGIQEEIRQTSSSVSETCI